MATLIVGGVTVPVTDAAEKPTFIGDRARMQDASMRVLVVAIAKREWTVTTNIMDVASANTLIGQLESTSLPVACSGDLMGGLTVNCFPELTSNAPVNVHGVFKRRLTFTLHEA